MLVVRTGSERWSAVAAIITFSLSIVTPLARRVVYNSAARPAIALSTGTTCINVMSSFRCSIWATDRTPANNSYAEIAEIVAFALTISSSTSSARPPSDKNSISTLVSSRITRSSQVASYREQRRDVRALLRHPWRACCHEADARWRDVQVRIHHVGSTIAARVQQSWNSLFHPAELLPLGVVPVVHREFQW